MNANISLRDYFAGLAMQELIRQYPIAGVNGGQDRRNWIAELAYAMADAMTKESVK